jgi:hypothetical protein
MATAVTGCAWMPGYHTYWESRVKEMCEKDGGVRIFEQVRVTREQARALPRVGDHLSVPPDWAAKPEHPVFIRERRLQIRDDDPPIGRNEQSIVRRIDQKVIGVAVSYTWTPVTYPYAFVAHPMKMSCPDLDQIYEGIERVYQLEDGGT